VDILPCRGLGLKHWHWQLPGMARDILCDVIGSINGRRSW
jgi:hypothetical protein